MKIGVNARLLPKPYTGIGQYTKNLFLNLARIDLENEYVLFVTEEPGKETRGKFPQNVRISIVKEIKRCTAGMKKTWWEQIQIPEQMIKEKVDIAFFPYPCNPWTADWYKTGVKTLVTIHDCIPWIDKKYRKGLLSKLYHLQSKKAVKRADLIFTVSKSSKKEIEKVCKVSEPKVKVVYNDADDVFKNAGLSDESVLEKYGLSREKYFLYVGGFDERKNVKQLVREYGLFANGKTDVPALVLVGEKLFDDKLYSSFDDIEKNTKGKIIQTGLIAPEQLKALYRNCLSFVHLSKMEGFNIPLLEAANCGAPLILSDIDVHLEIAKDCAIFVDIQKEGDCALSMEKMLDKEYRKKFEEKSKELATKYAWKESATKIKKIIESICQV